MKSPSCPLCGHQRSARMFEKNGYQVHACAACETAFIDPMPTPADLKNYYTLDYFKGSQSKFGYTDYAAESPYYSRTFPSRVRLIESMVPRGRILDIGCATGAFLDALGPHWEKHGIEVSKELLAAHPPSKDLRVFVGDIGDYPETNGPFDVVTLFDVLDHVLDPRAVLAKASRLLRPGGVIVVLQGDRSSLFARLLGKRWHVYIPPTHLWFFTRRGLSRLIENHGFETVHAEYEPHWASLSLCLFRLTYVLPFGFINGLYRKFKDSRLGACGIRFNFHDIVTLYARKK